MKNRQTLLTLATIGMIPLAHISAETVESRDPATIAKSVQDAPADVDSSSTADNDSVRPADSRDPATLIPESESDYTTTDMERSVFALIEDSANFTTLEKAIEAAGLQETLEGEGPYTVFAPTNAAFDKVGDEKLDALMLPENKEKLRALLLAHVVSGKMTSDQLKTAEVKTAADEPVKVVVNEDAVMVGEGKVVKADLQGRNGVIHAIDNVIMP